MLLATAAYRTAPTREAINALTSIASRWRHADRLLATDMEDISQIAFSPTDPTMVALTSPYDIEMWDVKRNTGGRRRHAEGAGTSVFSQDGHILAYTQNTGHGGKVVLWSHAEDKASREIPLNLAPEESAANPAFSSDGKLLGACVGKQIRLWSLSTDRLYRSVSLTHGDATCAFDFRNNSRELAYIDGDDIITWDIASNRVLARHQPGPPNKRRSNTKSPSFFADEPIFAVTPDGRSAIGGVAMKFSPDGSRLAANEGENDKISVWKLNVRDPLLEGTTSLDYDFAFTSDNHLLTAGRSGVFVESYDSWWALDHVCDIVNRNLTPAERDTYLPRGFDYKPTCRLSHE